MKYTPRSKINQDVARHVMGWKLLRDVSRPTWRDVEGKYMFPAHDLGSREGAFGFNPAERIEHAMMVLDKFYDWILSKNTCVCVHCSVWSSGMQKAVGALGKTREHAICLAALRAKGVEGY